MAERKRLKITQEEVTRTFSDSEWEAKFPPIMSVAQAAELLQVPKGTIYQWHSQDRLRGCVQRVGKHLRFFRDRLVLNVMSKGV